MSAHRTILGIIVAATTAVLPASAAEPITEQISFVYERIIWNNAKPKIEADFRRAATEKGLKLSAADVAGAAQAAFEAGVEHQDSWEEQQMVIRGCGPGQKLCFVITCRRCTSGK